MHQQAGNKFINVRPPTYPHTSTDDDNPASDMVEVRFSCTNLADKDFLSLSDPFLVCHILHRGRRFEYVGETETVLDDVNPAWMTSFLFRKAVLANPDVQFVLHVFDEDGTDKAKLTTHDFLGCVSFKLAGIDLRNGLVFSRKMGPSKPKFYRHSGGAKGKGRSRNFVTNEDEEESREFRVSVDSKLNGGGRSTQRLIYKGGKSPDSKIKKRKKLDSKAIDSTSFNWMNSLPFSNWISGNYNSKLDVYQSNKLASTMTTSTTSTTTTFTPSSSTVYHHSGDRLDNSPSTTMDTASTEEHKSVFSKIRKRSKLGTLSFLLPSSSSRQSATVAYDLERATNSYRARRSLSGKMTISLEPVRQITGKKIYFKFLSNVVLDKSSLFSSIFQGGRTCIQFFEIFRQSPCHPKGHVWNCIYRSEDATILDHDNFLHFSVVGLSERQLCNGVPDRVLRFRFMSRHCKTAHCIISYVDITAAEIMGMRKGSRHERRVKMQSEFHDDDSLNSTGFVYVTRASESLEKGGEHQADLSYSSRDTDDDEEEDEMSFVVKADHFISKRFISVIDADHRTFHKRVRKIPKFISRY